MIEIKFDKILEQHRFTISMIHNETGINRNTLTDLYYGRTLRIDLDTLDRLCTFFNKYDVKINIADIFDWIDQ